MAKIHGRDISFLLFLLLSVIQISCSKSQENETISSYTNEPTLEERQRYHPLSSPPPVTETDDYEVVLSKAPVSPQTNSSQSEADDVYNLDQVKALEPAPLKEVILPESEESSSPPEADRDDYISPSKAASVPAPSTAIPLSETNTESSKAPESSILPYKVDDANQNTSPGSNVNDYYNSTTENQDSSTLHEDGDSTVETLESRRPSKEDTQSTQVASLVDEEVDMQPLSSNPPVMSYTYSAEEETVDIVHEVKNQGTWTGQSIDGGQVAGFIICLCLVCLAGLVYNGKRKKKTQIQYQSLSKNF